jgi:hypothetical protein
MNKFILYATVVTLLTSGTSWIRAFSGPSRNSAGSSWSSHTGAGGGSWGGGSGGGGHK